MSPNKWDEKLTPIRVELERISDIDSAQGRSIDDLFVAWFVRAHTGCSWNDAFLSLTGPNSEKGLDAIHVDFRKRSVLVVQGKLRRSTSSSESRNDVLEFAALPSILAVNPDDRRLAAFRSGLDATAANLLEEARRGAAEGCRVEFVYLTTGMVSKVVRDESEVRAEAENPECLFSVFDGTMTLALFEDYRLDVVPRVPYITLEPAPYGEITMTHGGGLEARALVVRGSALADIYKDFDLAIFARNIRGFLGMTAINAEIIRSAEVDPEEFFYLNNGVTIICTELSVTERGGKRRITLRYPQIINGQQTTRSLHSAGARADGVHVLVRVIVIPSPAGDQRPGAGPVAKIVKATNWQNSIGKADLRTNDAVQIDLERSLRELGYQYLRRNENRKDAMRRPGYQFAIKIKKTDMAQAVGTCEIDGFVNRIGTSKAFDPNFDYYEQFFTKDVQYLLNSFLFVRVAKKVGRRQQFMGEGKWLASFDAWQMLPRALKHSHEFHSALAKDTGDGAQFRLEKLFEVSLRDMKKFYGDSVRGTRPKLPAAKFFKRVTHVDFESWAASNRSDRHSLALRAFVDSISAD